MIAKCDAAAPLPRRPTRRPPRRRRVLDRIPELVGEIRASAVRRAVGVASDSESPSTPRSLVEVAARCPTIDVQGVVLDPVDLGVESESHSGFHSLATPRARPPQRDAVRRARQRALPTAPIARVEDFGAVGAADV